MKKSFVTELATEQNITSFFLALLKDGSLNVDTKDDLIRGPLVVNRGEVVHPATKAALGGTA